MEEHGVENAQKSPYCGLRIYWLIFFFLVGVCHSKAFSYPPGTQPTWLQFSSLFAQ